MIIDKKKIIFVILTGGKSKRFGGGFKTFSVINKKSIFDRILEKLEKNKIEILINANENHYKFNKSKHLVIKDKKNGFLGPLAGIHSTMIKCINDYPKIEWIFTVPSDTPFLPINLLDKFCEKLDSKIDILIARSNNKIHPVVSMWNVNLLKSLESELNQGNRKIMTLVEKHRFKYVDFEYKVVDPFFNINTINDLKDAENFELLNA